MVRLATHQRLLIDKSQTVAADLIIVCADLFAVSAVSHLEDGIIHLQLQKALVGTTWLCCTKGHPALQQNNERDTNSSESSTAASSLSVIEQQQETEQMLLQRFQLEHPGFDFSGAHVSGNVPDAREFMGGIQR